MSGVASPGRSTRPGRPRHRAESGTARKIARGLGWSVTGTLMIRLGSMLVTVVAARVLGETEYGVFAVAMTVWVVLGTLAELGLGADLVRAPDLERRAPTVCTVGVVTGLVLAGLTVLAAGPVAEAFRTPEAAGPIRLMAVAVAVFGFAIVPSARLQRDYRQGTLLLVNGAGLATSAAIVLTLLGQGVGAEALALGQLGMQLVVVLGTHLATRTVPRFGFEADVARASAAFCLPLVGANVVSWLLITTDNLIVARHLGTAGVGLYVAAFNISSWPMSAFGQALRVVALPAFAHVGDDDRRNRALVLSTGPAVAVSTLLALGLGALAGPVVLTVYGEDYRTAAAALAGLAVFGGMRVVLDLVATFLIAAGATADVLVVQVLWLVAMVPSMWFAVQWWGLAGAGWSHVAVAAVVCVPLYGVALRRQGVPTAALVRAARRPLLLAAPAAVVGVLVAGAVGPAPLALLLGGLAVTLAFALPLGRWSLTRVHQLRSLRGAEEEIA